LAIDPTLGTSLHSPAARRKGFGGARHTLFEKLLNRVFMQICLVHRIGWMVLLSWPAILWQNQPINQPIKLQANSKV
jgi:hypothetical protein